MEHTELHINLYLKNTKAKPPFLCSINLILRVNSVTHFHFRGHTTFSAFHIISGLIA